MKCIQPNEAAEEIYTLIQCSTALSKIDPVAARRNWQRQEQLMEILANQFAELRGWQYAGQREFSFSRLAKDPRAFRASYGSGMQFDHAYCFRRATKPRMPVAVAAHLYDWRSPDKRREVHEFCTVAGLYYEAVEDFPSWWYPGQTQLIVYTARPKVSAYL